MKQEVHYPPNKPNKAKQEEQWTWILPVLTLISLPAKGNSLFLVGKTAPYPFPSLSVPLIVEVGRTGRRLSEVLESFQEWRLPSPEDAAQAIVQSNGTSMTERTPSFYKGGNWEPKNGGDLLKVMQLLDGEEGNVQRWDEDFLSAAIHSQVDSRSPQIYDCLCRDNCLAAHKWTLGQLDRQ